MDTFFVNEIDLLIYLLIIHMIMDIVLKHGGMWLMDTYG